MAELLHATRREYARLGKRVTPESRDGSAGGELAEAVAP